MFWMEILQRGRNLARSHHLDETYCSTVRYSGLSMIEWFGFLDKYYSEAPTHNVQHSHLAPIGFSPVPQLQDWMNRDKDPRFAKPTGRQLAQTNPEFTQALKNSKLHETIFQKKRDPRVVAASVQKFIGKFKPQNQPLASFANRLRIKPTGVQEDYVAKLLSRVSSPEMKQVIEKKLYEEKSNDEFADDAISSDILSEALATIVKTVDYCSLPSYDLPVKFYSPDFVENVNEYLDSDDANNANELSDSEGGETPQQKSERQHKEQTERIFKTGRKLNKEANCRCRICAGKKLEPMVSCYYYYY